jgi:hypothetical protein
MYIHFNNNNNNNKKEEEETTWENSYRWENNTKMYLKETGSEDVD